jgi:hypothetical protein
MTPQLCFVTAVTGDCRYTRLSLVKLQLIRCLLDGRLVRLFKVLVEDNVPVCSTLIMCMHACICTKNTHSSCIEIDACAHHVLIHTSEE